MHAGRGDRGDTIDGTRRTERRPSFVPPAMTTPESSPADPPADRPPASLRQVASAVFWSFFGVRKGTDMQHDMVTIKPHHVIIVGLVSGLAFVLGLVALVMFITRHG